MFEDRWSGGLVAQVWSGGFRVGLLFMDCQRAWLLFVDR